MWCGTTNNWVSAKLCSLWPNLSCKFHLLWLGISLCKVKITNMCCKRNRKNLDLIQVTENFQIWELILYLSFYKCIFNWLGFYNMNCSFKTSEIWHKPWSFFPSYQSFLLENQIQTSAPFLLHYLAVLHRTGCYLPTRKPYSLSFRAVAYCIAQKRTFNW